MVEIGRQGAETCVSGGSGKWGKWAHTNRVTHQGMGLDGAPSEYELGALPSSSPFRTTTSCAPRSPAIASDSTFFSGRPKAAALSEQGRACAPRRKSGGKTQLGSRTRRVYRPAASEPQLPRQASTGGCPRLRGGAKSAMSGELSSDATPLAKGPRGGGPSSLSTPSIVRLTMCF